MASLLEFAEELDSIIDELASPPTPVPNPFSAYSKVGDPDDPESLAVPLDEDPVFGPIVRFIRSDRRFSLEDVPRRDLAGMLRDVPSKTVVRQAQVADREVGRRMVDFNTFMSVGLNQCGSDKVTFGQLARLWNRQKAQIQQMTQAELRRQLECP